MKTKSTGLRNKYLFATFLLITLTAFKPVYGQTTDTQQVNVKIISDEADAVIAIMYKKGAGKTISDSDWQNLFASEGYKRLQKRESAMRVPFSDDDFKSFILSGKLDGHTALLESMLTRWKQADINGAARRSLAYLPDGSSIHAKIYPVIKPRKNSFVFDVDTDPAIFLFIDTAKTTEQFGNTLAHELHHIGFAENCKDTTSSGDSSAVKTVLSWISAFGEGFAMLAAAGGPDIHPHQYSNQEDRTRWNKDVSNFNSDLEKVNNFFAEILNNKLSKDKIDETGYSFFGIQGPWYTVGWKMSVTIEKVYGRKKLIECICNKKLLLPTYNSAAREYNKETGENLALWSLSLITGITE
jgi:hypothetical protein